MINLRTFSRILVGLVLVFSGFVKGVDPLGTAYRIEDYFIAYGTDWAIPLALFLSIALSTLEFVLGISLLLNTRLKALSWVILPLMILFTGITLYDALYSPVADCGCFGDAIKLTNWQTFYKNLVLIFFVYIIFKQRKKFKSPILFGAQNVFILIFTIVFASFSYYQFNHLPMIDFRDWKIGNDMSYEGDEEVKVFLIYKNKDNGEEKEYLSPDYPWNDSVWMSKWEFVDQRIEKTGINAKHDLLIQTKEGYDVTREIIENPDYQFLFVSWDITKVPESAFEQIKILNYYFEENDIAIAGLTSSFSEEVELITTNYQLDFDFFNIDDIALKTMIRANPGLVLLKQGRILNKWHYHDFPDVDDLEKELKKD